MCDVRVNQVSPRDGAQAAMLVKKPHITQRTLFVFIRWKRARKQTFL